MSEKVLVAIIGSSVISACITTIYTLFEKRKQNTINYITEERKQWREKIRTIADHIYGCEFKGMKEKRIGQYLVQLQMNINTYGKAAADDYEHDGHIWEIIEKLKKCDNPEEFNQYKESLLVYISLMLKEDWERSKGEVKGYTSILKFGLFSAIAFMMFGIYYFVICGLKSIVPFLCLLVVGTVLPLGVKRCILDERRKTRQEHDFHNERSIHFANVRIGISCAVCIMTLVGLSYVGKLSLDKALHEEVDIIVSYNENERKVEMASSVDITHFARLERELNERIKQEEFAKEFEKAKDDRAIKELNKELLDCKNRIKESAVKLLRRRISHLYAAYVVLLIIIGRLYYKYQAKEVRVKTLVNGERKQFSHNYREQLLETIRVVERACKRSKRSGDSWVVKEVLKIELNLLEEMKASLEKELKIQNDTVDNLEVLDRINNNKSDLAAVSNCIQTVTNDIKDITKYNFKKSTKMVKKELCSIQKRRGW